MIVHKARKKKKEKGIQAIFEQKWSLTTNAVLNKMNDSGIITTFECEFEYKNHSNSTGELSVNLAQARITR